MELLLFLFLDECLSLCEQGRAGISKLKREGEYLRSRLFFPFFLISFLYPYLVAVATVFVSQTYVR